MRIPACLILAASSVLCLAPAAAQNRPDLVIGGEEERGSILLDPKAVQVAGARLVVLEQSPPFLRVLTTSGESRQAFGKAGQGPDEFSRSLFMAYDSATAQLIVLDAGNARASYFAVRDTLTRAKTLRLGVVPSGGCVVDGRLWVISRLGSNLMHELTDSANQLVAARSIGTLRPLHPAGAHPMVRNRVTAGWVVCDSRSGTAYVVSRLLGEIQVISLRTGAQKSIRLTDFLPQTITTEPNAMTISLPPGGESDEIVGAILRPEGVIAIVGRFSDKNTSGNRHASYRQVLLASDGTQRTLLTSRWAPLAMTSGGIYCRTDDPAPTIARYPGGRCP